MHKYILQTNWSIQKHAHLGNLYPQSIFYWTIHYAQAVQTRACWKVGITEETKMKWVSILSQWRCELTLYSERGLESSPELSHGGLMRTLNYLTGNSPDDSHCEIAVSFLLVCFECVCHLPLRKTKNTNSHRELALRYSWDHLMTHHAVVAVGSLWELQTHGKLTASSLWSHLVSTLWAK